MTKAGDERWSLDQDQAEQVRLRAFISAQGVRSGAVDELAQDALLICLTKLDEFDRDSGDFGAWVRQIARTLVAHERCKISRHNQIPSDHETEILLALNRESAATGDRLVLVEELSVLRDYLTSLPGLSREPTRQRYYEVLSTGAIKGDGLNPHDRTTATRYDPRRGPGEIPRVSINRAGAGSEDRSLGHAVGSDFSINEFR